MAFTVNKARTTCSFRSAQAATLLEFMYHSRIVLSVGGSVWYMIRNLHCAVTIDSVLANSKTQNAFLFTVNAIFSHDYPLAVEPGSTPRPLVQKKLGEILYLLICCFLPCLSWLLRIRVRKSQIDLWITLYISLIRVFFFIFKPHCDTTKVLHRPSIIALLFSPLFTSFKTWVLWLKGPIAWCL